MKTGALWMALVLLSGTILQAQPEGRIAWHQPEGPIVLFRDSGSRIGVQIRDVTSEEIGSLKLPKSGGVKVEHVEAGGPADAAGIRDGDVIVEYAGLPVLSVLHLQRLAGETPAGRAIDIKIVRDGIEQERSVTVKARATEGRVRERIFSRLGPNEEGKLPYFEKELLPDFNFEWPQQEEGRFFLFSNRPRLGISAGSLTGQFADFLGVPGGSGVLVMEVHPDTPAAQAGLKAGDVITAVDGQAVSTPADLSRSLDEGSHQLQIVRDKQSQTLTVAIGSSPATGGNPPQRTQRTQR